MVRQRVLVPSFAGSIPAIPAIFVKQKNQKGGMRSSNRPLPSQPFLLFMMIMTAFCDFLGAVGLLGDYQSGDLMWED